MQSNLPLDPITAISNTLCPRCHGDRWLRRLIAHPYMPGSTCQVTRICSFCDGKSIPLQLRLPDQEKERHVLLAELIRERDPQLTRKERK